MKDTESRVIEWYSSLEECEIANKKFFGGRGMCHCFPDGLFNGRGDDWRSRPRDDGTPQDPPSTDLFVSQTHDFRYGRRYTLMENEVRN